MLSNHFINQTWKLLYSKSNTINAFIQNDRKLFIILAILSFNCNLPSKPATNNSAIVSDTVPAKQLPNKKAAVMMYPSTHLRDTISVSGNFILFLLPDSARFESYDEDSGIYDADSDFGVGIANTLDTLQKNKKYKNIKGLSTLRRFIIIEDCLTCPKILDRDSVNYGVILSSKGKEIKKTYNQVHSGDYLQDVDDYFNVKN
jgi:hypothetical protein